MLVATDKPIISMCEWIRKYLMRIATIRYQLQLGSWNNTVMPMPMKRLEKEIELSVGWLAIWSDDHKCEVENICGGNAFVLDIANRTCSCNFWELVGIPCRHVVAAMSSKSHTPEDYVHYYYSRYAYVKCYSFSVTLINGEEMWPVVKGDEMLPPSSNTGREKANTVRRRKVRRKVSDEDSVPHYRSSKYTCNTCGIRGHNAKGCKHSTIDSLDPSKKVSVQNTSTAPDQTASTAPPVETTAHGPLQTSASAPVNVGKQRINKKARITHSTFPQAANESARQPPNRATASVAAKKYRRPAKNIDCSNLRRSGRNYRYSPLQVDRVEQPNVQLQIDHIETSKLKGPCEVTTTGSTTASVSPKQLKNNIDYTKLRRSSRNCRDSPLQLDSVEQPDVQVQIDHIETSKLKAEEEQQELPRQPLQLDRVEQQDVEIQIHDVHTSKLTQPAKESATAPNKATSKGNKATSSKSRKPIPKLDFTKLRRSDRTCYFGPQPKLGEPGTLKDNPIEILDIDIEEGDDSNNQFIHPKVGSCLCAMRKLH
ncbi:hypothetical protein TSUD_413790 [Trifolium subterraneum]|uniref:SWIM-type domain-containing protein n=1 Tax=Trifolium subterraneum TaxID=3900 RepID=A0A2Z6PKS9_TRISU|nr:hypothetical protein TSUD_413790 [Trifolium subterraneum]